MIKTIKDGWLGVFLNELSNTETVRIISPFIKEVMIDHLLENFSGNKIQFITRYNLDDFKGGGSSLNALKKLLRAGAEIKGIKGLHSKLYLFDTKSVIIASANFTSGGFFNNKEFGVLSSESTMVTHALDYFNEMWLIDPDILKNHQVDEWEKKIKEAKRRNPVPVVKLGDEGTSRIKQVINDRRYFVKFFGRGNERQGMDELIADKIQYGPSHYALTFSRTTNDRRPTRYRNGDIVFLAQMSYHQENDYSIFARATAIAHDRQRDIARQPDFDHADWVKDWPVLVRVRGVQFIAGTLANCPRLNDLTAALKYESFEPTLRNYQNGRGNLSTTRAVQQKSDIRLSDAGAVWMEDRFAEAIKNHGNIPQSFIDRFYQGIKV